MARPSAVRRRPSVRRRRRLSVRPTVVVRRPSDRSSVVVVRPSVFVVTVRPSSSVVVRRRLSSSSGCSSPVLDGEYLAKKKELRLQMRCQIKALGLYFCGKLSSMPKNGLIAIKKRRWPVEGNLKFKESILHKRS